MFITIKYSCRECGIVDRDVIVPARTTEDLGVWMGTLGDCISTDHRLKSPRCRAQSMQNLKIPITENKPIGEQL
jgi:hypothetical protein